MIQCVDTVVTHGVGIVNDEGLGTEMQSGIALMKSARSFASGRDPNTCQLVLLLLLLLGVLLGSILLLGSSETIAIEWTCRVETVLGKLALFFQFFADFEVNCGRKFTLAANLASVDVENVREWQQNETDEA